MVGAKNLWANEGVLEARTQQAGDQEIINAPADVPVAHTAHGAPPCVMAAARLKFAEGVNEAGFDKGAEASSFLGRESVIAFVRLGVGEVQLGVRDVEIAAEDDGLFALQHLEVSQERAVPLLPVREAREF